MKLFGTLATFFSSFLPRKPVYRMVKIGENYAVQYISRLGRVYYISRIYNTWSATDNVQIRKYCIMNERDANNVFDFMTDQKIIKEFIKQ